MNRLALACAVAMTALLGASATASAAPTGTALTQLRWLAEATHRVPVSAEEQVQHLSKVFLDGTGGTDGVNAVLTRMTPLSVDAVTVDQPDHASADTTSTTTGDHYVLTVHVDAAGLLDGAQLKINNPAPGSWAEVDAGLGALDARVSYGASVIEPDGSCRTVHGVAADTQRPLGSAFKLYVLGALGQAVAEHRASWDEKLAIRDEWKSLPSGQLQNSPAGTEYTLAQYADYMISISDNTATDHLIHRLGVEAVQRQLYRFGNSRPSANIPFMTTRNLFVLKGKWTDAQLDEYLKLPPWRKAAQLRKTEQVPLSGFQLWPLPKKIDQVEWFGSPNDICRAYSGLLRMHQPQIDHALSINDGSLLLDPAKYPTVWYKGGSEPGVLTMNYLVRDAKGRTVVSSVMASSTEHLIPDPVAFKVIPLAKAGVLLTLG